MWGRGRPSAQQKRSRNTRELARTEFLNEVDMVGGSSFFTNAFLKRQDFATGNVSILKVPKREIFVTEFFVLRDPTWVGDLRNEPKKPFV